MAKLAVGDKAPAFALKDQHGKLVRLSGFKGKRVVVYFYPKADTPGCTQQACGLRDAMPQVGDTVVLGISPDPPARQAKFDTKYSLGFPLRADEDQWRRIEGNDNAFDALVASLVARARIAGLCHEIPQEQRELAAAEGWIAVPMPGSLLRLAERIRLHHAPL